MILSFWAVKNIDVYVTSWRSLTTGGHVIRSEEISKQTFWQNMNEPICFCCFSCGEGAHCNICVIDMVLQSIEINYISPASYIFSWVMLVKQRTLSKQCWGKKNKNPWNRVLGQRWINPFTMAYVLLLPVISDIFKTIFHKTIILIVGSSHKDNIYIPFNGLLKPY